MNEENNNYKSFIYHIDKSKISTHNNTFLSYEVINEVFCRDASIILEICGSTNIFPNEADKCVLEVMRSTTNQNLLNKLLTVHCFLKDDELVKKELNLYIDFLEKEKERLQQDMKDFGKYNKIVFSLVKLKHWRNELNAKTKK